MNEEQFKKIRTKLEKAVTSDSENVEAQFPSIVGDSNKRYYLIKSHRNFVAGINLAYGSFCVEFHVPYTLIKSRFNNR